MSLADARRCISASAPRTPEAHLIESDFGRHLFVADGSRLFDAEPGLFALWKAAADGDGAAMDALLRLADVGDSPYIDDAPPHAPPVRALSLAIAQKCNLGCSYCYAQQGDFGGAAKNMSLSDALSAVDLLVAGAESGARLNLAFLGGEPLVNRPILQAAARHARALADARGANITFSVTTNGTVLTEDDASFFEDFGFAVTVSVDGPRETHDALRPFKGGAGSFDALMRRVKPLLHRQRKMQVSARVTVTPVNLGPSPDA